MAAMGTAAPQARLVWISPMHQHCGRVLLASGMGRHYHALEKSYSHFPFLRVWCSQCGVHLVGVETRQECAPAIIHGYAPDPDRGDFTVGEPVGSGILNDKADRSCTSSLTA